MIAGLLTPRPWVALGALMAGAAVALGAYGWHSLEGDEAMRQIFMLGVQYHMWHALALIAAGWRCTAGPRAAKWAAGAGALFLAGILLFSANLYIFAITGDLPVAGAAPVGGGAFMAGWVLIAVSALVREKS